MLDDYSLKCWGADADMGVLGNENAAYYDNDIGDEAGEMGDNLAAVNLGTGNTVLKTVFCSDNEYVASNVCTVCPAGESNPAGDEQNGADNTCSCTASSTSSKDGSDGTFYCINGGTAGGTTGLCTCTCSAGYSGTNCQTADACSASSTSSKDGSDGTFYCINGGITGGTTGSCTCTSCDTGYEGDNCHTAILCAANQRVVSKACTACAPGATNAAGDDASGSDTTCAADSSSSNSSSPANPSSPALPPSLVVATTTTDDESSALFDPRSTIPVVFGVVVGVTALAYAVASFMTCDSVTCYVSCGISSSPIPK